MLNQYLAAKEYLHIDYDEGSQALFVTWLAPAKPEFFKTGMIEVTRSLRHFNTTKVIWDTRKLGILPLETQNWLANIWIYEAIKSGYMYAAFYTPKDFHAELASGKTMNTCINNCANARRAAFFDTLEQAKEWIQQF
ncbi:hypothetical protein JMN32_10215 [Fulvivirga sp. 29W222]|uniref:STAS/SEC14 domain-containing protein n=1 Tax=Fulvivirga marina TaxID=2494733 RepID=A0A937KBT3_9BACT|nr:hypothetical protein [Fulvivirga marina]MBL6446687.1 hypothetical protein [Fulvivirga marina]